MSWSQHQLKCGLLQKNYIQQQTTVLLAADPAFLYLFSIDTGCYAGMGMLLG
jgi:hypothetical protein